VLVGTISIETSEHLSYLLSLEAIQHNVLNAKQHEREAEIIKEAGELHKVTIATNMAGRGTDIKLGQGVINAGGLRIVGTERHESRRIDNQLRGRSGRQGDPGSSKFYVALEDDLMRIFGGEKLKKTMERIGMKPGESIEHRMVSRSIEKAQERVEKHNFDIRKHLIEYDDVMNQQRTVIYKYRRSILEGAEQIKGLIQEMISDVVHKLFEIYCPKQSISAESREELYVALEKLTTIQKDIFFRSNFSQKYTGTLEEAIAEFLIYQYEQFRATMPQDLVDRAEKWILLETIDHAWRIHLLNIDHLKEGIGWRGYGAKNPLIEYKKESFFEFERMLEQIRWDIVQRIFQMKPDEYTVDVIDEIEEEKEKELESLQLGAPIEGVTKGHTVRRATEKIGRNEPCPCGSGLKYKKCCGK
jgi:preprotein translocase subunit SecA